ncbi:MAG TPA: MotA/TolQ/ExbB proton channel family protein [bacterium]|nr:MotA/TolQ/ExbB proton channel family protein [bacterium]HOB70377.1 MotA/TolQ/ExbB proton channel family protein [bacterium]HPA56372.1 MotA/TolQ/ExbB proton channel family protein [bacterium]HPY13303.1 MotA/TolQ/ExbB proton channel family protein [bacterium]HQI06162.1 MotA/TolQ/ExbB proton channel family protein [bacterium]
MLSNLLEQIISYLSKGGFVMAPLAVSTAVLWYALGYRFYTLQRGTKRSVRELIRRRKEHNIRTSRGILDSAVAKAFEVSQGQSVKLRDGIDAALFPFIREMSKYRVLVQTIVITAPLLGLLGTVTGMIETFDSLGDMSLYSQSGGIAGGISQALFTTQMGLAVAVPGLIAGRMLQRKETSLLREIAQVKDILCAESRIKGETDEI